MIFQLDIPHGIEYSVEIGYGLIYILLAISTFKKYKNTGNRLAIYFFGAFLMLSLSGFYGGIAGFLGKLGYDSIPIFGSKIMEIYKGLTLIALLLFLGGLFSLKTK